MSKLGLHVHCWNNRILDYCKNVGAAVIKSLDHNDIMVNEVKRAQPKTLLVARLWVPHQPLDDPIKNARDFTDLLLLHIDGCHYDAAEGYNEWDGDLAYHGGGPEGLEIFKRYGDFEAERSRILHREGLLSVVGGCSVGTPPEHWFSHFLPALQEGDFLHLHEYSAPRMWDAVNWHCLKYRHVYDYLKENHLPMLPFIISECGIDGGVCGRGKEGWRKFTFAGHYMEQWKWMDAEWMKDWYIVGGCAFDCGPVPGMGWQSFKMDPEMLDLWAPYVRGQGVSYWEPKEEPMDGWKNVPPEIARWKQLVGKITSEHHVPIPDYQGVPVSPAKAIACLIMRESRGDPDIVNPDSGATGLMQIMPFHFEEGQNPCDPEWNIRKGFSIFEDKITKAKDLYRALFWYSGKADRLEAPFIEDYWEPFVAWYKEFWAVALDAEEEVNYEKKYRDLRNGAVAAITTLQAVLDA